MPEEIHLDGSSLQPLLMDSQNFKRLQPFFWHFAESKQIVGIRTVTTAYGLSGL